MPIAAVKEVTRSWILGDIICDAWIMIDLLCCTASILHLVAIALDRYWAITNCKRVLLSRIHISIYSSVKKSMFALIFMPDVKIPLDKIKYFRRKINKVLLIIESIFYLK